jgi:hypothetical protein
MPTCQDIRDELSAMGVSGYSGKNKKELEYMLTNARKPARINIKRKMNILFDSFTVDKYAKAIGISTDTDMRNATGLTDNGIKRTFTLFTKTTQTLKSKRVLRQGIENGVCGDLVEYFEDSIDYSDKQDIVSIDPGTDISMDYAYLVSNGSLCGVIVAQRGECAKDRDGYDFKGADWNTWTVRIICGVSSPMCRGSGLKMLGLYCYCLKMRDVQKYGLLEVYNNYKNIPGYCLYSKLGFVEADGVLETDLDIRCEAFEWMKMATDIGKLTFDAIVQTVRTGQLSIQSTISTDYCDEIKDASRNNREPLDRSVFKIIPVSLDEPEQIEKSSGCNIM